MIYKDLRHFKRAEPLQTVQDEYYERKRRDWAAEKPARPQKKGFKVSPARTSFGERGPRLVSMLVESYSQGNITFADLTEYLGVRGRQVEKVVELAARIA